MKKLLYIVPLLLGMALTSCYDEDIEKINSRLDAIENTQIATISQQITSINNSILLLNNTDKELKDYITALETEAENLQNQLTATNIKIDEVKQEILSTISSEKAALLAELEALRNTTTTRLEEIATTIAELQTADGDMSAQIEALEKEAEELEAKLTETNSKIDSVKNELTKTISTEKAAVLAELEAFKATVNGELEALKAVIEELKAKDTALEGQIADLKTYVDSELKATEDWVTATFATLEQYNTVVTTIATIEGQIEGINESIAALENRINEKIAKDIEAARATLSANLQKAVEDITTAYITAIATAKEEITTAYTAALEEAISALETSMKEWVNEQLTAYSTIVETDAKITALQSEMDGRLAAQKTYLEALVNALSSSVTTDITAIRKQIEEVNEAIAKNAEEIEKLRGELAEQKEELTEAYTAAIAAAIAESEGKMNDKLAEEIAAINDLEKVWQTALSVKAVATQTRAADFINLPITAFEADAANGTITIEVDGTNLGDAFFAEKSTASATIEVSDGNNYINSAYINITTNYNIVFKDKEVERICVLNWDTDCDGKLSYEEAAKVVHIGSQFEGTNITSFNELEFFINATSILTDAFKGCERLCSISIPSAITEIKANAFSDCYKLKKLNIVNISNWCQITFKSNPIEFVSELYINGELFDGELNIPEDTPIISNNAFDSCRLIETVSIPSSVSSIGDFAFNNCTSLTSVSIGKGVNYIGEAAFEGCETLTTIYCRPTVPPSIYYSRKTSYSSNKTGSFPFNEELIIYVPNEAYDRYMESTNYELDYSRIANWYAYRGYITPCEP